VLIIACKSLTPITKSTVFSEDAIQADEAYYTKAVLEYHLINLVLKTFNAHGNDRSIVLSAQHHKNPEELIYDCKFKIPKRLIDLNSGFQYRYYVFNSNNTAALQAFGIVDVKAERETQYLVIDYIQFRDYRCPNLPTIRYAVGLRSELKFTNTKNNIGMTVKGGLAKLAAQVELGIAEVNFSLKTIGLTGKPARLNIPQGVSFNVTTYKDFQNSIAFLKNDLEDAEAIEDKKGQLIVKPEIIPLMDAYRPNAKSSLNAFAQKIIALNIAKDKLIKRSRLSTKSKHKIDSLYNLEVDRAFTERDYLNRLHNLVYTTKPYTDAFSTAVANIKDQKIKAFEKLREEARGIQGNLFDFFPGYPNLNKRDSGKLRRLEQIYYDSDSISLYAFNKFLNVLNTHLKTESELDTIIIALTANPTLKGLSELTKQLENNK